MELNSKPSAPMRSYAIRTLRLLAGLYVGGCVTVCTLFLLGASAALSWIWAEDLHEKANKEIVRAAFALSSKTIDLTKLNGGDWTMACAIGRFAAQKQIEDVAQTSGISLTNDMVRELTSQKLISKLAYITRDGRLVWVTPDNFGEQIEPGEAKCVLPSQPILNLPTEKALERLRHQQ